MDRRQEIKRKISMCAGKIVICCSNPKMRLREMIEPEAPSAFLCFLDQNETTQNRNQ